MQRLLAAGRPFICPFHELVDHVPPDTGSVLDIGCGSGLFLNVLDELGRLEHGLGIDVSRGALATARKAAQATPRAAEHQGTALEFAWHDLDAGLPEGSWDVVAMIDVLHHVPPAFQQAALAAAAHRVAPGGRLLFKDMVARPRWRAIANRLHDLLLARQWIHYAPLSQVVDTVTGRGLTVITRSLTNLWWYGHETVVFEKPVD